MRSSNPGSPPSSNRTPPPEFACVPQSLAMRNLIGGITASAEQKLAIPLCVGPNTLETMSCIRLIAGRIRSRSRPAGIAEHMLKIVTDEKPLLTDELLYDESVRAIAFLKGDTISSSIQMATNIASFQRIDLFLAIVMHDAKELVQMKKWNEKFHEHFCKTFFWPEWSERSEDHDALLRQMKERLVITRRLNHAPELDTTAEDLLRSAPWKGVDDAYKALQHGYDAFHADPDAVAISADHIMSNALRALSPTRRAEKANSVPPSN